MAETLLLDAMVGRLRTYLRLCGHDTLYALDEELESDAAIQRCAESEGRTLLTRDRDLAAQADDAVLIRSQEIEQQLAELAAAGIELEPTDEPQYCGVCNGPLEPVADDEAPVEHAPDEQARIWRCRECGKQFWKGSHWEQIEQTLAGIPDQ